MRRTLVAGLLVACACAKQERDPRPIAGAWFAEIRAVHEAGHGGFAVVSLLPDRGTRANTTLNGGSPGGVHPWHVHDGTCESGGPIVGDPAAYPPLRPDESGNASATVALETTLSTAEDARYHVNLHRSPQDDTVVACGDFKSSM